MYKSRLPYKSDVSSLKPNCENCFALCCVALPFTVSSDFAIDKHGGMPCPNLQSDLRCSIHSCLRTQGFKGCTVFECFGAGQKVSQVTFKGESWQKNHENRETMFEVFPIMQQLHEMLWYLYEALSIEAAKPIHHELSIAFQKIEELTLLDPDKILELDVPHHRSFVNELLIKTSDLVWEDYCRKQFKGKTNRRINRRGADLVGANLKGKVLAGTNFRGAYLIAADLRNADLRAADFIGADLRDADLGGANLTACLFLTQMQINSAKGDIHTKLPKLLSRPAHWSA